MKVGYARVSSVGQSLEIQLEKLKATGCKKIYSEKKSGRQYELRPQLIAAMDYVREGDTLVITRLDRMARSILDLSSLASKLREKDVELLVLDQSIGSFEE